VPAAWADRRSPVSGSGIGKPKPTTNKNTTGLVNMLPGRPHRAAVARFGIVPDGIQ